MMSENYSDYISVPTGPILKQKEKIDFSDRDRFTSNLYLRFIFPDKNRKFSKVFHQGVGLHP
jgi:hypothetical protein